MILYIKNCQKGSLVHKTSNSVVISNSINYVVNSYCMRSLFTYSGYRKSFKFMFNLKSLIPVYINRKTFLIPTKNINDYDNIFVNYIAVKQTLKIDNKITKIVFIDGSFIIINRPYSFFIKKYQLSDTILHYIKTSNII